MRLRRLAGLAVTTDSPDEAAGFAPDDEAAAPLRKMLDGDFTPPPRSLIGVEAVPAEQGGGLLLMCDCGTTTHLIVEGAEDLPESRDIAVTCDGCKSVTWMTVGPVGENS